MPDVLDQFVRNLRESRLMSAEEIASLHRAIQASRTPRTIEDVGKILVDSGKLTAFQVKTIDQGHPRSLILGEYILLDLLGKGGMGVVFRAKHRMMDRVVALKTLSKASMKPEMIQRFDREVKAAARLSHQNIVTAFDAGEYGGAHYLVMEFVAGRDLAAIVKERGPLPLHEAVDFTIQAARGLAYAHQHGVVHRDVKPSNLLLNQEGVIKILDMGLAMMHVDLTSGMAPEDLTGVGQIMGTIDYMSPEQAEDMRTVDHRADIYSLGCTLYYLLVRRPPYGGPTVLKRILAHRHEPLPSVAEHRPDCPEPLAAVIQQMMAKRPEERFQTMVESIAALEAALAPPGAVPPLAAPAPAPGDMNWLQQLTPADTGSGTNDSQVLEPTFAPPADSGASSKKPAAGSSNIHSSAVPPIAGTSSIHAAVRKPGAGSSSIVRKSSTSARYKKKKLAASSSRKPWIILAAVLTTCVLTAGGIVFYLLHSGVGRGSTQAASSDTKPDSPRPPERVGPGAAVTGTNSKEKPPAQGSGWRTAWNDTVERAERLMARNEFGRAIDEYKALSGRFRDPVSQKQCNDGIARVEKAAEDAFLAVKGIVRGHIVRKEFSAARSALQPVLDHFGAVHATDEAKQLLAEVAAAERPSAAEPAKTTPAPVVVAPAPFPPDVLKQREQDAQFAKAMEPVEAHVAAWDFLGAGREMLKIRFDAPKLNARLATRRDQIRRMSELKGRIIAAIRESSPPLTKIVLGVRGLNGDVETVDDRGITFALPNDKHEAIAWADLGAKTIPKLMHYAGRRDDAGDWLAAGLLCLACRDDKDSERYFDQAQSLGADTSACLALLAAADLAKARALLDKQPSAEAEAAFAALETRFGSLPWFAAYKSEVAAVHRATQRGVREKEAEDTFAAAAALYRERDFFEMKPLVERLKTNYANTAPATDPQRKPAFAEMERVLATLGPLVRVQKDGRGDATTIQAAIDAAPAGATIRIEDAGPYAEVLSIPKEKDNLTLCGKRGVMPTITTAGAKNSYSEAIYVHAPQITLERLVVSRADLTGQLATAISGHAAVTLREVVVHGHVDAGKLDIESSLLTGNVTSAPGTTAKNCVFFGHFISGASAALDNVLHCHGLVQCGPDSEIHHATIAGQINLAGTTGTVSDSIIQFIDAGENAKIEHSDLYGDSPYRRQASAGKGCINVAPQFIDPANFNFKLQPASPCHNAASDGRDQGFAYTPEIVALMRIAAEIRRSSAAKF